MALSDSNATQFAFKKLFGKAHTSPDKGLANEANPSSVTLAANTIFADTPPPAPTKTKYVISSNSVEYLRLSCSFILGTDTSDGRHGFKITLPDDYEARSSNSKKGTYPYINGQEIAITSGGLQLVPPTFGANYEAFPYHTSSNVETLIPVLDARDWVIDYFAGIFFQQDPPGTGDNAANPRYVDAFLYIGDYTSEKLGTGGGGGAFFSSTTVGSIFTTGSAAFVGGQSSPAAPDAPSDIGNDVFFFVSGSVDSRGTPVSGTAVFGGDVAISGTLAVNLSDAAVGSQFVVTTDGKVGIGTSTPAVKLSVGGNMEVGEYINHKNDSDTFIRFQADDIEIEAGGRPMIKMTEGSTDQVLVMSGGVATSPDPKNFTDSNFFVSGSIGAQGTSNAGTSVFGGDVVVSGALNAKQGVGTLATSTSVIHISSSNAPTSGSVLVARSSTEASWQQAIVFGEQPTGTKNGSNVTFTLANGVINNTDLMFFVNGLLQLSGAANDYTLTGSEINFNPGLAPFPDDVLTAIYRPDPHS